MRNDLVCRVALVDRRLEDLYALSRNFGAPQPADQLFAFAGKHRTDHDFYPPHIAFDNVHSGPLLTFPAQMLTRGTHRPTIHLCIIERRERRGNRNAKGFVPLNQIRRENPPRSLPIANPNGTGKPIDGIRQFKPALQNFVGQLLRYFDATGATVEASATVAHISPAFQKNTAASVVLQNFQTAFEADKVAPWFVSFARKPHKRF